MTTILTPEGRAIFDAGEILVTRFHPESPAQRKDRAARKVLDRALWYIYNRDGFSKAKHQSSMAVLWPMLGNYIDDYLGEKHGT